MRIIEEYLAPKNTGWATEMKAGQVLRLTARTIIDFVAFDQYDYGEAFDQAPSKEANGCIYLKKGPPDVIAQRRAFDDYDHR